MAVHFADRTMSAIREKRAPVCVGFDPLMERLPKALLDEVGVSMTSNGEVAEGVDRETIAEALRRFGREVIQIAASYIPIIKINIAFFERYHAEGVQAYRDLVRFASEAGLIVIGDVKRADIGHSTTQYAHAQLSCGSESASSAPDAVTVNPYFGFDAIRPFVEIAREQGRGLFVLVQTSNQSAAEVQGLSFPDERTVCQKVGELVQTWAESDGLVGECGYSAIGAVVSPRDIPSTERIRTLMPNCIFLVPGFGAQGRTAQEVARCFKPDGSGAIVTASRSVIYAYQQEQIRQAHGDDWRKCIDQGCKDLIDAVRTVVPA